MSISIHKKVLLKIVAMHDLHRLHNRRPGGVESIILAVPKYVSQLANADKTLISKSWGDIADSQAANRFGADLSTFNYWAWRSCGVVCIHMLLTTKGIKIRTMELVKEGLRMKGYDTENDIGWYHEALVELANKYGLEAESKRYLSVSGIVLALSSNKYVIASIHSSHGGHMILIYGAKILNNKQLLGFHYNDPNNHKRAGHKCYISIKKFKEKFKYMGVVVSIN
ncbi:hypothetical protein C4564_01140 [Candidatus Microgenomates bacterium]|nr:MAG: hypothetical protein C4564_01140 [Candidatus Microgenomates bacterium]